MSHEVTATKFRPQTFDQLIGQEFVASSLKNSIKNNKIANAYLLSGPRGVGKTSAARIIAKALNCESGPTDSPCNKCENCVSITKGSNSDVIEIDGASNTGINDVRVIQEEIMYPPVNSKYKVYIIDEVHMLSKSAFNALLKTIEEPPEHIVFIFATTEINKVLPTIRSRCQQFNFRLIPRDLIAKTIMKVLDLYKINYEDSAILWVANEGQGSMRDSFTLLDQIASFCEGDITLKKIQEKLGLVGEEKISILVAGLIENNREKVFNEFLSFIEMGVSPEQILIEIIKFFRNLLLIKSKVSKNILSGVNLEFYQKKLIDSFAFEDIENILEVLFKSFESLRTSIDPQTEVELTIIKLLKYRDIIRPQRILNDLAVLKNALFGEAEISQEKDFGSRETTADNTEDNNLDVIMDAGKSEILNIVKNKIKTINFQLATALNNVSFIEEKDNKMFLFFTQKMHYDIAKKNEEFLTQEAISVIGKNYNKDFRVIIEFKEIEKKQTVGEINKMNIKDIFHGQEIL